MGRAEFPYFSPVKRHLIFVIVLLAFACDKVEYDKISPEIDALALNAKAFRPGQSLIVSYTVSDNLELEQVRARIKAEFAKGYGEWKIIRIDDINGAKYSGQMSFIVPDTALAGLYSLSLQAADTRGNGTVDSTLYFSIIQEGLAPVITFFETEPPMTGERLFADTATALTFQAVFSDNEGLSQASISFQGPNYQVLKSIVQPIDSLPVFGWDYQDTIRFRDFQTLPLEMVVKATNLTGHQVRRTIKIAPSE